MEVESDMEVEEVEDSEGVVKKVLKHEFRDPHKVVSDMAGDKERVEDDYRDSDRHKFRDEERDRITRQDKG